MTVPDTSVYENHVGWKFDNTYSRLPEVLFSPAMPAKVPSSQVAILNHGLAEEIGLDLHSLRSDAAAALFSGQELPAGSFPIAQAYAGHQYGGYTMLGDGRAILLGEHLAPAGNRIDVQLKGPGRTRFSRRGDGKAAFGPMLREYIISEAMAAMGIPTTRSLAVVTTGETVYRTVPLQGAVLTRIAKSHIRVGTFEYAARIDQPTLHALADYTIGRHYPELASSNGRQKYLEFFRAVADRQAALVAKWQSVGFIHGVLNTDNVAISGETMDYGPCAFMNKYHPDTVFSSIDHGGRYAYGNQPIITQWNLARFAETLLPLIDPEPDRAVALATDAIVDFQLRYEAYWLTTMRSKLGLIIPQSDDAKLIRSLLDWMQANRADFTNTFRELSTGSHPSREWSRADEFQLWYARWQKRLEQECAAGHSPYSLMRSVNPAVIPRNHRVEEALAAAEERSELSLLHELLAALDSPYHERTGLEKYQEPPADEGQYRTFCGT